MWPCSLEPLLYGAQIHYKKKEDTFQNLRGEIFILIRNQIWAYNSNSK